MPKNQLQRIIDRPRTAAAVTIVSGAGSGGGGGVTDHGLLTGLGDDDPYLNNTTWRSTLCAINQEHYRRQWFIRRGRLSGKYVSVSVHGGRRRTDHDGRACGRRRCRADRIRRRHRFDHTRHVDRCHVQHGDRQSHTCDY